MALEESGSSRGTSQQWVTVREVLHKISSATLGTDWSFAKFTAIRLRVNIIVPNADLEDAVETVRDLSAIEFSFCTDVWSEAGLQPIEQSRRYQRDHYRNALLNYPGVEDVFGAQSDFDFQYSLRKRGEKEYAALVSNSKVLLADMAKAGEIDFVDTFGNPATHFDTSLLASVAGAQKAVVYSLCWMRSGEPSWLDLEAARRAEAARNLGGDWIEQFPPQKRLHARRYQMYVEAGLKLPDNEYQHFDDGIGLLAKKVGISRTTFTYSVRWIQKYLEEKRKAADLARQSQG